MVDSTNSSLVVDEAASLESAVERTIQAGLAEYVSDLKWANPLVDVLHEQLGGRKLFIRIGVKLFAAVVRRSIAPPGRAASKRGGRLVGRILLLLPQRGRILDALAHLEKRHIAETEYQLVLANRLNPGDVRFAEALSHRMRADLIVFDRLHEINRRLRPQPHLTVRLTEDAENRHLYAARHVPLVGRENELAMLKKFLGDSRSFIWWMVTGPGGIGKSRLTLELCLSCHREWRIGWLSSDQDGFDWAHWEPSSPTALIVDYAEERAERIGDIIRILEERVAHAHFLENPLTYPVRILLLARTSNWIEQLLGSEQWRRSIIAKARYSGKSLDLSETSLDDDALWTVLTSFLPADMSPPSREETLGKLQEIDSQRRPLFAALAGEAVASGEDLRSWDARMLVTHVLRREREHFWCGADERHQNLLALSTMVGGIETAYVHALDSRLFPSPDEFDPAMYEAMSSSASAEEDLKPLEPDILGEVFVLEYLRPRHDADRRVRDLSRIAWRLDASRNQEEPSKLTGFLARAAMDFPSDQVLLELTENEATTPRLRALWSEVAVRVIVAHCEADQVEAIRELYRKLIELTEANPAETTLRKSRAHAMRAVAGPYAKLGEVGVLEDIYRQLAELVQVDSSDALLRQALAETAICYARAALSNGAVSIAEGLHNDLVRLAVTHQGEIVLQEKRARLAVMLSYAYAEAGQLSLSLDRYQELQTLAQAQPDENMRQELAHAILNVTWAAANQQQPVVVRRFYEKLTEQSRAYPDEPKLREARAKAAMNFVWTCVATDQIDTGQQVYAELSALAEAHEGESVLWEMRAGAARQLAWGYSQKGDIKAALQGYEELCNLEQLHPNITEVRRERARVGRFVVWAYSKAGQPHKAGRMYQVLVSLSQTHPEDSDLRHEYAQAAVYLTWGHAQEGVADSAHKRYQDIAALAWTHPNDTLRERQADAALHVIRAYSSAGRVGPAQAIYKELCALADRNSEEIGLRETWAQAVRYIIAALAKAGRREAAHAVAEEISKLASAHSGEPTWRTAQAVANCALGRVYADEGHVRETLALYERQICLAEAHAEEPILREHAAHMAIRVITACSIAGRTDDSLEIYNKLVKLSQAYPGELSLRKERVEAAVKLAFHYGKEGRVDSAHLIYQELIELAQTYADDPQFRKAQATAAVDLAVHYGAVGEMEAACAVYDGLVRLAQTHPSELPLQQQQARAALSLLVQFTGAQGSATTWRSLYGDINHLARRYSHDQMLLNILLQARQRVVLPSDANAHEVLPFEQ